jgi:hypothetical protein
MAVTHDLRSEGVHRKYRQAVYKMHRIDAVVRAVCRYF